MTIANRNVGSSKAQTPHIVAAESSPVAQPVLETRELVKAFGGLVAIDQVDVCIEQGSVYGIIGANGAGKTTLLNLISGAIGADRGSVLLSGADITKRSPAARASMGLRRTFQNIRLFSSMSVLENVLTGMHTQTRGWLLGAILGGPAVRRAEADARDTARRILDDVGLGDRCDDLAGKLPYGDQRRLELARALSGEPKVLLLDEPAAGLNSAEKGATAELISSLPERYALSVVLVEHDMDLVSRTCSHVTVLEYGRTLCDGSPAEVLADQRVINAYLGTGEEV